MKRMKLLMATALIATVGMGSMQGADRDRERGGLDERRKGGNSSAVGMQSIMQNMNEEQRTAMREMFMEMRDSGQGLMQKTQRHRTELQELMSARIINEKAIRAKVMAIAELEADSMIMRAKAFSKLRDAGVDENLLKMMMSRMGGGQSGQRSGMSRGGGSARFQRGGDRGGFGDRPERRPREGSKEGADSKQRRPEFDR